MPFFSYPVVLRHEVLQALNCCLQSPRKITTPEKLRLRGAAAAAAFPQERREVAKTSGIFSADFRMVDFRTFFIRFQAFWNVFGRFLDVQG